jgi:PBSX family phage terminase large subunit
MPELDVPVLTKIPPKLYPIITEINNYRYFLFEGGRGSAKSQSIARWLLYLAEKKKLRIVCGRETQKSIDESVYTILCDLIREYDLFFDIYASKIVHKETGTTIKFKGFREQGSVNIKGLEGVDILWIEEAQSITKQTLDIILPTIRKPKSKLYFTMNRFMRNDAVFDQLASREDCLHININYWENPFCPDVLKEEARLCRERSEKDYEHIWCGHPLDVAEDYLFNFAKLEKMKIIEPFGDLFFKQSVMAVDFSGNGGDLCVAKLLERRSNIHWENTKEEAWNNPDTDLSVGKTINLYGEWKPDVLIVDADGLGYPMFVTISKSIPQVIGFKGAGEAKQKNAGNQRADGWIVLKEFTDREWLICKSDNTIKDLETIKRKFRTDGKIYIQMKTDIRKETGKSPDRGDVLMMAVYAIRYHLGKMDIAGQERSTITRVNKSKRR